MKRKARCLRFWIQVVLGAVGSSDEATVIVEVTPARRVMATQSASARRRPYLSRREWVGGEGARVRPLHLSGRLLAAAHHGRLLKSDISHQLIREIIVRQTQTYERVHKDAAAQVIDFSNDLRRRRALVAVGGRNSTMLRWPQPTSTLLAALRAACLLLLTFSVTADSGTSAIKPPSPRPGLTEPRAAYARHLPRKARFSAFHSGFRIFILHNESRFFSF